MLIIAVYAAKAEGARRVVGLLTRDSKSGQYAAPSWKSLFAATARG